MKTVVQILFLALLFGCAANKKIDHRTEDQGPLPNDEIEAISSNVDSPPEPIGGLEAIQAVLRMPEEVLIRNKEGWVIIEATINAKGRVASTKVAESSGFPGMDSEAMIAVARVAWKPGRRHGEPVATTVRVPVTFQKN
jgi:TonB family protein